MERDCVITVDIFSIPIWPPPPFIPFAVPAKKLDTSVKK